MAARWALTGLLALSLAQVTVEATMWSNIGIMAGQDQANKRSAEDGHVRADSTLLSSISQYPALFQDYSDDDMDLAASEAHYDSVPFTELGLSGAGDKAARQEPMRRRK